MPDLTDRNGDGAIRNMSVVAHIDDDLLFMNPDISNVIAAGHAHATVYLTAGDAGNSDATYWQGREEGARAAYSAMTGSDAWVEETVTVDAGEQDFQIVSNYLQDQPQIRLYFLRLPDGMPNGDGSGTRDFASLEKLWNGTMDSMATVEGASTYDRAELTQVLQTLIDQHQPDRVMRQDHESVHIASDHSDHIHGALFVDAAAAGVSTADTDGYVDYGVSNLAPNLSEVEINAAREVFRAYLVHDRALFNGYDDNGDAIVNPTYEGWLHRQYLTDDFPAAGESWSRDRNIHEAGDVNNDGRADLVDFTDSGVSVTPSRDGGFGPAGLWIADYGYDNGGWRIGQHERMVADVNGDGMEDVVGFGEAGVLTSLSTGSSFQQAELRLADFSAAQGWRTDQHQRRVGDVNGDGRADVVGFGSDGVVVALSNGTGFDGASVWIGDYAYNNGWRTDQHERLVGDMNGDGLEDVVGFGDQGVLVSLSDGSSFQEARMWMPDFSIHSGGWQVGWHDRAVGDVNGDGRDDVVGFGSSGVLVALSNGSGLQPVATWSGDYGSEQGWNAIDHDRMLTDVNGDGMDDILAYGNNGERRVALSTGNGFQDVADPYTPQPATTGDEWGDPLVLA
ncbi:PIG-L family deacetylase [Paracoccus sp. (in: a-proteobacteria)]|uniref:PIG-L family deacetylase n=1 Tax=Paracoccus sp. TaxID=267 RepID=UPI003A888947